LPGGTQPLDHHRDPHHHVTGNQRPVVDVRAAGYRGEHLRNPERENQDADHLQHRRQAVHPVVGVIGRSEPTEIDPRPGHRKRGEAEPGQPRPDVTRRQHVRQLRCGDTEGDDERQVEQQLQRSRDPMRLVRVTPGHSAEPVRPDDDVVLACRFAHPDIFTRSQLDDPFAP
jgi:hypothetical protein